MKFSFENLHKNKKLAFVDGLLTGAVLTGIGVMLWRDWREMKEAERLIAEAEKNEITTTK